ncbi:MAG: 50S ribosomal protein L21 [Chlamydiia bacterium]|nr:50S ribosomal protein L21 [Chlamydiia bacterium]
MKAIIKTGGKQYKVKAGDILDVELLGNDESDKVIFDSVLLLDDGKSVQVGAPTVEGATVVAEMLGEVKDKKLIVYKYKRRHNCRVKKGHRQKKARVKVLEIKGAA